MEAAFLTALTLLTWAKILNDNRAAALPRQEPILSSGGCVLERRSFVYVREANRFNLTSLLAPPLHRCPIAQHPQGGNRTVLRSADLRYTYTVETRERQTGGANTRPVWRRETTATIRRTCGGFPRRTFRASAQCGRAECRRLHPLRQTRRSCAR